MVDGRRTVNPIHQKHSRFESYFSHKYQTYWRVNSGGPGLCLENSWYGETYGDRHLSSPQLVVNKLNCLKLTLLARSSIG